MILKKKKKKQTIKINDSNTRKKMWISPWNGIRNVILAFFPCSSWMQLLFLFVASQLKLPLFFRTLFNSYVNYVTIFTMFVCVRPWAKLGLLNINSSQMWRKKKVRYNERTNGKKNCVVRFSFVFNSRTQSNIYDLLSTCISSELRAPHVR